VFLVAPVQETSVDAFREMLELNLTAPFSFVRAFLPEMRRRGAGHLVTVGSIADRTAFTGNAAYAASKYGLRGMHEVLRAELKGSGVRASLVSPGPVDTPLWDSVDPSHRVGHTPRANMLSPDAVADAVRFVVTAPAEVNVDELRLSHS
jgi:NADP-dependent 3-hydroxy acid dehydrogenase YdfG